jgi:hypothetical protein
VSSFKENPRYTASNTTYPTTVPTFLMVGSDSAALGMDFQVESPFHADDLITTNVGDHHETELRWRKQTLSNNNRMSLQQ